LFGGYSLCYDWSAILYSLIVTNILGLIFETAFAYSFEISLKPTKLDKLESPEHFKDEADLDSSDQKKVPRCNVVLEKCIGEMIGIFLYTAIAFLFLIEVLE
jgi:hypothetical protein